MISPELLEQMKAAIGAAKADLKDKCIIDAFGKSAEWYRGGWASLEALEAALEYQAQEEGQKAESDKMKERVMENVDTLRSWMPGMPLMPSE